VQNTYLQHFLARKFAKTTIKDQMEIFKSWGILGDWTNHYATYDANYIKVQFKIFHKLYQKNLIYRDIKPIYWSPSSR
jgi:isoleucyl-tRNA synthetase